MFFDWAIEIAKTFAFALVTTLIFLFVRRILSSEEKETTRFSRLRADAYLLVVVGFFQIVLAVLLSRLDIVYVGGQMHVTLMR
jgi:hypothetical protein